MNALFPRYTVESARRTVYAAKSIEYRLIDAVSGTFRDRVFETPGKAEEVAEKLNDAIVRAMREWLAECPWDDVDEVARLDVATVAAGVKRFYQNGLRGFYADFDHDVATAEAAAHVLKIAAIDLRATRPGGLSCAQADAVASWLMARAEQETSS